MTICSTTTAKARWISSKMMKMCFVWLSLLIHGASSFALKNHVTGSSLRIVSTQQLLHMVVVFHHEEDDESSHLNAAALIPAGEDALQSAQMARSIRQFRNSRGLLKTEEVMDKHGKHNEIMERRSHLLSSTTTSLSRRTSAAVVTKEIHKTKTTTRIRGWATTSTTSTRNGTSKSPKSTKPKAKEKTKTQQSTVAKSKRSSGIDLPYSSTIQALRVYHSIHGDLVMPRRYTVPEDDAYPSEWHGVDLARTVYDMKWWQKNVKQKPERVADLGRMGFLWERLQPEWNLVLEALITYSSLHGNVMVPVKFVVPYNDDIWPKATWGIPLGDCVYRIRHRHDFLRGNAAHSRRDQLNGLNFVWDMQEHRFQLFYTALQHFARIEGHNDVNNSNVIKEASQRRNTALRVPSTFVVPQSDAWPKELWGYQLGAKCTAVRQRQLYVKGSPRRQQLLENLRFQWCGNASLGWLEVVHASAIYSKLHNRSLDVPFDFKVPQPPTDADPQLRVDTCTAADEGNVWPWPEYLWGLPLGQRLKDVRLKGAYLKGKNAEARRRQLDALGFNWNPKRGRPRKPS